MALSYVVAVAGSFVALEWADRMRAAANQRSRRRYFLAGTTLMGVAIWTMHFVGMLALHLGLTVRYDPLLSAASIIAAALGAGLAFLVVNRPSVSAFHVNIGGIAMGLAIAAMHYLGMASIRMAATIRYDAAKFVASIALAIAASAGALSLARRPLASGRARHWIKLGSALAMGFAIAGMHYVGMAAATYRPSGIDEIGGAAEVAGISLQNFLIAAGLVIGGALIAMAAKTAAERQDALTALEEKTAEAVAASRAKDIFLASLSHELRTPLNPALLLAGDAAHNQNFPSEARAVFADIARNIALEARLIDDLLDLTKIERGLLRMECGPADVQAVLADAIRVVEPVYAEKRLQLARDFQAVTVYAAVDPDRLKQVFWNLLQNAAKYSEPQGAVRVRTTNRDDRLEIEVADQGIGMTPEELAHCFDGFTQGQHRRGGLGMGLTISRKLLELMGGTITAESEGRGRGSMLRVSLQALPAPSTVAAPGSIPPMSVPAGLKILVVEDHAPSRTAIERLLQRRGHQVTSAATAAEALAAARDARFDLALSDIGLPDGDGYALMRALRELQPVVGIAITGFGTDEDIRLATEAGFATHLTKPVTIEKLNKVLNRVTGQR